MEARSVTHARAKLAAKTRHHPGSDRTEERRELAVANLDAYIRRVVETAPPLTPEQSERLALLLRGSSDTGGAAA